MLGVNAAAAGTLTFMVGAENAPTFDKAKAVLDLMGKNVTHCGEVNFCLSSFSTLKSISSLILSGWHGSSRQNLQQYASRH